MERFLLFAGSWGEGCYDTPGGWKAFKGSFPTFDEALQFYKEHCFNADDEESSWGHILDSHNHNHGACDCDDFMKTLPIIEMPEEKPDLLIPDEAMAIKFIWTWWQLGFIRMSEYNVLKQAIEAGEIQVTSNPTRATLEDLIRRADERITNR